MFKETCNEYIMLWDPVNGRTDLSAPYMSVHEERIVYSICQSERLPRFVLMYCVHDPSSYESALGGFSRLRRFYVTSQELGG